MLRNKSEINFTAELDDFDTELTQDDHSDDEGLNNTTINNSNDNSTDGTTILDSTTLLGE